MATDLSRRDFLKGMTAGALSIGTMGLLPAMAEPANAFAEETPVERKEIIVSDGSPEELPFAGEVSDNGWLQVLYKDQKAWVSGKYGRTE